MADQTSKTATGTARDASGAVNLMAHPLAGMAAMSAIGAGFAAQAMGTWLGLMSGAMNAAQRVGKAAAVETTQAQKKARVATDTLIADARAQVVELSRVRDAAAQRTGDVRPAGRRETARKAPAAERAPTVQRAAAAPRPVGAKAVPAARRDDLKAITGVGPKLEQALNAMGIASYAQIAALSVEQIADIERKMGFPGRIVRDRWLEQATELLAG